MKRWLVTTSDDDDLGDLRSAIAAHGGSSTDPPIPSGPGEQVLEVDGPDDLPDRLSSHPAVRKISPDTPKHKFG